MFQKGIVTHIGDLIFSYGRDEGAGLHSIKIPVGYRWFCLFRSFPNQEITVKTIYNHYIVYSVACNCITSICRNADTRKLFKKWTEPGHYLSWINHHNLFNAYLLDRIFLKEIEVHYNK